MFKSINSLLCLLFLIGTIEFSLYKKECCEVKSLAKYIEYDIKYKNLDNIGGSKYKITVKKDKYIIESKRESIFKVNKFKVVKYVGIVK